MHTILILQIAILSVLGVVMSVFVGVQAVFSLVLGGVSYIVPTLFSVIILRLASSSNLVGAGFIFSEVLKILLAIILMAVIIFLHPEIKVFPYLLGLLSVSHIVFLFYLKVHRHGK